MTAADVATTTRTPSTTPSAGDDEPESAAVVDLAAIRRNLRVLRTAAGSAQVMAVLKADAYGHGVLPVARAALAAGTTWLGVARASDALRLRTELRPADARVLTWLHTPGAPFTRLLAAEVDVSVGAPWALEEVAAAARDTGRVARVHLKVDTGMGRNGVGTEDLASLARRAASLAATGHVEVVGLWTHLACADTPGHPATHDQVARFEDATDVLRGVGIEVPLRHVAASAGTLTDPRLHYDLVRPGLAVYGLSPLPPGDPRASMLTPAMTLRSRLAAVRTVPAGTPVSYGSAHRTTRRTVLGLVPLGYADGVPRHALGLPFRGGRLQDLAREALRIAAAGLGRRARLNARGEDERDFLAPLLETVEAGRTPAEYKLALFHGEWGGDIDRVFSEFAY